MSGKPFIVKIGEITQGNIKFGKIEDAESIPNAKFSRAAVGMEGMPDSHLTCIPRNGKYRDNATCLHIVFDEPMFSAGLNPQYAYVKGGKVEKIPANVVGYNMMVPLEKRDGTPEDRAREKVVLSALRAFHAAAVKIVLAAQKRDELPLAFKSLKKEELAACVQPIETPGKKVGDVEYPPTLFAKVNYFKAKPAEEKNGKKTEAKSERWVTVFKGPGGKIPDPKTLIKAIGKCRFVLKVNHINFLTGDKLKDFKIKFDTDLTEVNYTKTSRQEANVLGDNTDEPEDEGSSTLDTFKIDPKQNYGDAPAASSYNGGDESDSSADEQPKKKKVVATEDEEEAPAPKKKKVVATEDEEPPKKKKKPVVVEEEEEAPAPKKKKRVVDEE